MKRLMFAAADGSGLPHAFIIALKCLILGPTLTAQTVGPDFEVSLIYDTPYTVTTLAGQPEVSGTADGVGNAARFNRPVGLALDQAGNLFVADQLNHAIRKITPAGVVTTFAGVAGVSGGSQGTGSNARFLLPGPLAIDSSDNLFVHSTMTLLNPGTSVPVRSTIQRITSGGVVTALPMTVTPYDMVVETNGNFVMSALTSSGSTSVDSVTALSRVTPAGVLSVIAGVVGTNGNADGTGSSARFGGIRGVAMDASGTVYVCDVINATIRKISPAGVVTTVAGISGRSGYVDGPVSVAKFGHPWGLVVDPAGNIFVAESSNLVRKISTTGMVSTIAGSGERTGTADGTGGAARFSLLMDIVLDSSGRLFVSDYLNNTIRMLVPAGGTPGGPPPAGAPVIMTHPVSNTVPAGTSTSFSVTATGSSLSYQWRKDGVAIAGATGASLTLTNPQAANAGVYTVVVTNASGSVTSSGATLTIDAGIVNRFSNISVRTTVEAGKPLIAGFTITGTGSKSVLIRAVGPTLASFGVSGTLADPKLEIYSGTTKVNENDTWAASLASTFGSVGAFALTAGSKDAALVTTLPAGSYTVQISGADGGTGEALVEIYEVMP